MNLLERLGSPALYATVAGVFALLGLTGAVPDFIAMNGDTIAGLFSALLAFLSALGVVAKEGREKVNAVKLEAALVLMGEAKADEFEARFSCLLTGRGSPPRPGFISGNLPPPACSTMRQLMHIVQDIAPGAMILLLGIYAYIQQVIDGLPGNVFDLLLGNAGTLVLSLIVGYWLYKANQRKEERIERQQAAALADRDKIIARLETENARLWQDIHSRKP